MPGYQLCGKPALPLDRLTPLLLPPCYRLRHKYYLPSTRCTEATKLCTGDGPPFIGGPDCITACYWKGRTVSQKKLQLWACRTWRGLRRRGRPSPAVEGLAGDFGLRRGCRLRRRVRLWPGKKGFATERAFGRKPNLSS